MEQQKNFCSECNCKCFCDADCGGDVKKCTSKKSKQTDCRHCCNCYIKPLCEKHFPG